ncbi:MAG TPA: DUF4872 domain-containing protein [Pseudonocardiaceae bacterium]|jgi:hypothetical protein|nr:DUF4872 domain-containing protein [Pseudonocardiaceae bacterium]
MAWDELIEARWTHAKKYGGLFVFGTPTAPVDLRSAVAAAIGRTTDCLPAPARSSFDSSFGFQGMRKWATSLTDPRDRRGWPKLFAEPDARRTALASVVSGLADDGAARRLYAAFLDEAADLLTEPALADIADTYRTLGDRWIAFVDLAGAPEATPADLAERLPELADAEQTAALS